MTSISGLCVDAKQHPVLFLMGPTASGKTDLAAYLYDHLDCELISVDSVQVYRGMDVGSAKPDAEFLADLQKVLRVDLGKTRMGGE